MARRRIVIPDVVRSRVLAAKACHYCGDRFGPWEVDHVRPVARGGTNDEGNLVPACEACNTQKRAMLLHEWIVYRKTLGMPWPPPARHATEPEHYQDDCPECELATIAFLMVPDGGGWRCHYRCEHGHIWTCWWSNSNEWFTDCRCMFCAMCCLEAGGAA